MKLMSLDLKEVPPLRLLAIESMSDVVVLAGPNGVGKTSLLNNLLGHFRSPSPNGRVRMTVEATCGAERESWGGLDMLDTSNAQHAQQLTRHLQRNRKRGQLHGGVLNFDSSRAFEKIEPYGWSWNFADPFEEDIGWDQTFQPAKNRFQDVVHSMLRKLRSQKEEISTRALAMQRAGHTEMPIDFPDPLEKFKSAFSSLLPGKTLLDLNEQTQKIEYQVGASTLPLTSLSSGEREVVTIVFDFLLRDPQDCIIVFDEPELHLHPELSYRLLRTLRDAGDRNQFIFCTHSPDIITASLDQTVVFVAPAREPPVNQAITVREEDETSSVLALLGQSVGVISLGKRLVLIEGEKNSLDKQTYGAITGADHPDLVLVPAGGKGTLATFVAALDTVLKKTIWGVEWFMLADGDAAAGISDTSDLEARAKGRLRFLSRYHLENYFLDEQVLAAVFDHLEHPSTSWQRDPAEIRAELRRIAAPYVSYGTALKVSHVMRLDAGNVDLMPKNCHALDRDKLLASFEDRRLQEHGRLGAALEPGRVAKAVQDTYDALHLALQLDDDTWKHQLPGRPILKTFAAKAGLDVGILKRLYLKMARSSPSDPFADVRGIFQHFSQLCEESPVDASPVS